MLEVFKVLGEIQRALADEPGSETGYISLFTRPEPGKVISPEEFIRRLEAKRHPVGQPSQAKLTPIYGPAATAIVLTTIVVPTIFRQQQTEAQVSIIANIQEALLKINDGGFRSGVTTKTKVKDDCEECCRKRLLPQTNPRTRVQQIYSDGRVEIEHVRVRESIPSPIPPSL